MLAPDRRSPLRPPSGEDAPEESEEGRRASSADSASE